MTTTLTKQQMDAAGEFANATIAALKVGEGAHPPTVVAASARMAGIYLFRSFGLKLPEGSVGRDSPSGTDRPRSSAACPARRCQRQRNKKTLPSLVCALQAERQQRARAKS